MDSLELSAEQAAIADKILEEIRQRLLFLDEVGLDYLSLDRLSSTLSGGEAQRIQLATSLGSHLVGALYVLDEPSIGLHPRDTHRLIDILKNLRDLGNTILVVEHDPDMIAAADYVIDLGPGAGEHGGSLLFAGPRSELLQSRESLTARYLNGELRIPVPTLRHKPSGRFLRIYGARAHNLQNIDLMIPLHMLVAITGVSGSGKSTLVHDVIYKAIEAKRTGGKYQELCDRIEGDHQLQSVVLVDQSPIGRTPRSNPSTYLKAFDAIREAFASTPEAKKRGYTAGHFSFNIPGGRCEACQGEGIVTVEMQFLADVELICEECRGTRFKSGVLEVRYREKNVHEVLQLTVREALVFFAGVPKITSKLRILDEVGLGYLRLGQSATTLSGGEAQRLKLAAHLTTQANEGVLYIFDEPTTGLHFDDIQKLLTAFRKLIDGGASILVIEHNLDIIKSSDWIIDLGPEGGAQGGQIVATGTPEQVARNSHSFTGKFLSRVLANNHANHNHGATACRCAEQMKRMSSGNDFAARWFRVGLATAWIATAGISLAAQSQRKTPAKSPATSTPQEKEDPLAPLLRQANEAIDKMDFAAALDPLQKYIAQRPDEAYPHFQLGYAYAGLKRAEDAKSEFSRAIALDPKMAAAHLNLGLVLMDSDPAAAAEAFRHAAELQPTESRPRFPRRLLSGTCRQISRGHRAIPRRACSFSEGL